MTPPVGLHRLVARLCPRDFHRRFGAEMEQTFVDGFTAAAAHGRWAAFSFSARAVADLVACALIERRMLMPLAQTLLAIVIGLGIGWIDLHSGAVQAPALLVLLGAALFGALAPRRAWRWALAVALGIPAAHLLWRATGHAPPYPVGGGIAGTLVAIVPGLVGAYGGAVLRRLSPPI